MKIKMTQTRLGTYNGFSVSSYKAGVIYDTKSTEISERLVRSFLAGGIAKPVDFEIPESIKYWA